MGSDDAKQLGEFSRTLAAAPLPALVSIVSLTLDDCLELLRKAVPPGLMLEMIAAVSAELHKRNAAPIVRAPTVGNA